MANLRTLPKVRDSLSFAYFEHCRIEQGAKAIVIFKEREKYVVPCASISTLLLGPGSSITHAAIKTLAENACLIHWVGEDSLRFYANGTGSSGNTERLLHQARLWANESQRLSVVRRMYEFRFQEQLAEDLTLQQIRGLEGVRVRTAYGRMSKATGVEWQGRDYKQSSWENNSPINKALSMANSCLYGVCQAAINSVAYSPALGFIHTGKPLSFVYDVADLYKAETTIPAAFEAVAEGSFGDSDLGKTVRKKCRQKFSDHRLMRRIVQDIDRVMGFANPEAEAVNLLWDDQIQWVEGGKNWSEEEQNAGVDSGESSTEYEG
jgi:CRISP-associated protein Cas1